MGKIKETQPGAGAGFIAACIALLLIAFFQCYKTTHDLHWAYDTDFDRDMAFIRNSLDGHFGQDPNYKGEYLWYNPLLFSIETVIVRISGLPINTIVTQSGIYLNLLGPIFFTIMICFLFDYKIALASLLSYLFLASGNLVGTGAATFSPWLYPGCFSQFLFYLAIILSYQAFTKQKYSWFLLLGASIGVAFLGHAAPAILIILILISIQGENIILSIKKKDSSSVKKYIVRGAATFISFVIVAFPFLFFIAGKYHLHIINTHIFEYHSDLLVWWNFLGLLKANFSVAFIISIIDFIWFYKNFHQPVLRKIILNWLFISAGMLVYTILLPGIHEKLHLHLPDTVPSYHYLFYLKAIQSVFFGFGFVFLFNEAYRLAGNYIFHKAIRNTSGIPVNIVFILSVFLWAVAYFPVYKNRKDFVELRRLSLAKEHEYNKIEVYEYITNHIPSDKVILCEEQFSIFPVMATSRKLVCASILFSNPYTDFGKRYADVNSMLTFLKTKQPASTKKLFEDYHVGFALLANKELDDGTIHSPMLGQAIFKNDMFTLYTLNRPNDMQEQ